MKPAARLTFNSGRLVSALAVACYLRVLWIVVSPSPSPSNPGWPEAALVITVGAATLASLSRQLPGQNVILAAATIGGAGLLTHSLGPLTGIPFGRFHFTDGAGPGLPGVMAGPLPMLWIVAILNSRGVARLILQPWRGARTYGFWWFGLTTLLTLLFAIALDPFATHVRSCRQWQPTESSPASQGTPLTNPLGWLLTTPLILALATPALINKRPGAEKSPPDYHPLVVWVMSLMLFATGAIVLRLWPATAFCIATGFVTSGLALRGARSQL